MREFNVLTDTYSAEYGKRAGAQVSVVTQSGTNQLHGTIFEFLRNSAFDSPGPFDQGTVPPFRRNQFGGAAGGPTQEGSLILVRQLRRIPPVAGPKQPQRRSRCSGADGDTAKCRALASTHRGGFEDGHAAVHVFLAATRYGSGIDGPFDDNTCANPPAWFPAGLPFSTITHDAHIQEDFGTLRTDYNRAELTTR